MLKKKKAIKGKAVVLDAFERQAVDKAAEKYRPDKPMGYARMYHNIRLNREQAIGLRVLTDRLVESKSALKNGRKVKTAQDAIKWFCENAFESVDFNA